MTETPNPEMAAHVSQSITKLQRLDQKSTTAGNAIPKANHAPQSAETAKLSEMKSVTPQEETDAIPARPLNLDGLALLPEELARISAGMES